MTTARLALAGRPLPRIEDAVRIGELVRAAAIRTADRAGDPEGVPPEISGHGLRDEVNHQHAFYLPEDADTDGFIDHVLIHAPGGLSQRAVRALDDLHQRGLWTQDGAEWGVVFEGAWDKPSASGSGYGRAARIWVSVTPYLHPWEAKSGFGVMEQVSKECAHRGLHELLAVRILPSIRIRGRERRPVHLHRFRSKRGLRQPGSRGSILEITFAGTVDGPLALGFGCHYGLGLFFPAGASPEAMRRATAWKDVSGDMTQQRAPAVGLTTFREDPLYPSVARPVSEILETGKVVTSVDVLIRMRLLAAKHLEDWRRGRVPYLERVINCNLTRLSRILRILRFHAHDLKLMPSVAVYRRWGQGPKQRLRFTKAGDRGSRRRTPGISYGPERGHSIRQLRRIAQNEEAIGELVNTPKSFCPQ